jgi:hypothetical protein
MKKAAMICGILLLILLLGAWWRYYMKNNWEKTLVYEDWIKEVFTLKRWKIDWISTTYYEDWSTLKMNFKDWVEDWEAIAYFPNWKIKNRLFWKDWEVDYSQGIEIYYENWNYETLHTPDWQRTEYYKSWQVKKEWIMHPEYNQIGIWKAYNEGWEQIAEWEYINWEPYSWIFLDYDYIVNDNSELEEIEIIETYNDWDLISTEEYEG